MDILFLQGPHLLNHSISVTLPPLGFLAVAGYLREKGFSVRVVDCCIYQWGWKTTERLIKTLDPQIVGIGGPIAWLNENLRLARLIKQINPNCTILYGGPAISIAPELALFKGSPIDFVIFGEGEKIVEELLLTLKKDPEKRDFTNIKGILYLKNGHITELKRRPLIKNLDELPIPAYDLLPIERYGNAMELWIKGVPVYHSRGCTGGCKFCACWGPMSDFNKESESNQMIPKWRTKSVKKMLEELKYIEDKWKRELFVFIDDTWNVNPK